MNDINIPISKIIGDNTKQVKAVSKVTPEQIITTISTDTRTIQKGDWFICLRGEKIDGHQYIAQALDKGASGVIIEEGNEFYRAFDLLEKYDKAGVIEVLNTTHYLGEIARYWRKTISPNVIAITGSNGKTSTKELLYYMLDAIHPGKVHKSTGNWNNQFGVPFSLLQLRAHHKFAVIELGTNHPGEIAELSKIAEPDYAIITSISRGHIGNFGSTENIAKEKSDILLGMNQPKALILHKDTMFVESFLQKSKRIKCPVVYPGENISLEKINENDLIVSIFGRSYSIAIQGKHQFDNFSLALTALTLLERNEDEIILAINKMKEFSPTAGRLSMREISNINVWDDSYNANPDSFYAAMKFLYSLKGKRVLFGMFGKMGELGEYTIQSHEELGKEAANSGFESVLFSCDDDEIQEAFINGWSEFAGKDKIISTGETDMQLKKAVEIFKGKMKPNDHLLVKGSRAAAMERVLAWI